VVERGGGAGLHVSMGGVGCVQVCMRVMSMKVINKYFTLILIFGSMHWGIFCISRLPLLLPLCMQ
jgi:hypothetical protein